MQATVPTTSRFQSRRDLSDRLLRSAATTEGVLGLADVHQWLADRQAQNVFRVQRIPLEDLDSWHTDAATGNIVHDSGRFFSVEGVEVRTDFGAVGQWRQPIIRQPEVGVLGILVREIDGVLHFLMQAKMEPGNVNVVQLSPTVQATRSNYTRVHRGSPTPYLEYFARSPQATVLVDALQSEQGAWFLAKRNRNMVVEVSGELPESADHRWLTLGQINSLLLIDNCVNMDARTVLSCLRASEHPLEADRGALHSTEELLSWFAEAKTRYDLQSRLVPLEQTTGWTRRNGVISNDTGRFFDVIGVSVQASSREVSTWCQPLIAPREVGVVGFLVRRFCGTLHVLVRSRVEAGYRDVVELAPTVQCAPGNYGPAGSDQRPAYLDLLCGAPPERVLFQARQSEEGGRFYQAENDYLVVDTPADLVPVEGTDYRWITVRQLSSLVRHSYYLNIQARSLLACLSAVGG